MSRFAMGREAPVSVVLCDEQGDDVCGWNGATTPTVGERIDWQETRGHMPEVWRHFVVVRRDVLFHSGEGDPIGALYITCTVRELGEAERQRWGQPADPPPDDAALLARLYAERMDVLLRDVACLTTDVEAMHQKLDDVLGRLRAFGVPRG
jgi:hypothetical protein